MPFQLAAAATSDQPPCAIFLCRCDGWSRLSARLHVQQHLRSVACDTITASVVAQPPGMGRVPRPRLWAGQALGTAGHMRMLLGLPAIGEVCQRGESGVG